MEKAKSLESGQFVFESCLCPFWLCDSGQASDLLVPQVQQPESNTIILTPQSDSNNSKIMHIRP